MKKLTYEFKLASWKVIEDLETEITTLQEYVDKSPPSLSVIDSQLRSIRASKLQLAKERLRLARLHDDEYICVYS